LYLRGRQALPDTATLHSFYTIIFLIVSLSVFIGIFAGGKLPLWLALVVEQVGGYWAILFVFFIAAALLGDLLRVTNHFFGFFPARVTANYPQAKLLYFFTVLVLLGIMSFVGFKQHTRTRVVKLDLSAGSDTLTSGNFTIVAASDIHLGNIIRKGRLIKWVELINSQKPDIILLAGDIFDHSYRAVEAQQMGRELARLNATYGVYAIPGNHDYYTGIEKALDYMERYRIKVLRDQAVTIGNSIIVIGRDDLTNKNRKQLETLMAGLNSNLPIVVLDHQPLSFDESVKNQVDLHLSGHTHNGQLFPFNRIVSRIYKLGYGYLKTGNTHIYVSSGMGLWGAPIRLGTQSEIVKIRLKTGEN